jgi:RHS repeat-associated protein
VLGEYDAKGNPLYEVVWLNDQPLAVIRQTRSNSGGNLKVTTDVDYIYADHLDTPRLIVRGSGDHAIVWRWDIAEPFGNGPADDNPNKLGRYTFNLRLPGQVFDSEAGLHYNHHRDYDAYLGRYTTPDPLGLGGGDVGLYNYASGDPLSYVDPLGLFDCGGGMRREATNQPGVWRCVPDPGVPDIPHCMTAECAAGLPPTPKPNPTACEMECGVGSADAAERAIACAVVSQAGKVVGVPGIPVTLACKAIDKYACVKACEEKKKCP